MRWPAPSHSARGHPPAPRQTIARTGGWGRGQDRSRRDPPASIPFACRLHGAPSVVSPVPYSSVARRLRWLHILNRSVVRLPSIEAAIKVSHIGVAHLLKGVRSQSRSSAPGTVQDDAPVGVEL